MDALWRNIESRGIPWLFLFEARLVTQVEQTITKNNIELY